MTSLWPAARGPGGTETADRLTPPILVPRNTGQGGRPRAPAATVSEDETVSLQVSAQPSTGILGRQCPDPPCTPGQVQRSHVATRWAPRTLGELGTRQLTHWMWGPSPPRTPHPAQTCTSPPYLLSPLGCPSHNLPDDKERRSLGPAPPCPWKRGVSSSQGCRLPSQARSRGRRARGTHGVWAADAATGKPRRP